jgi:hypothetical protein
MEGKWKKETQEIRRMERLAKEESIYPCETLSVVNISHKLRLT